MDNLSRFWGKVTFSEGCWLWSARTHKSGRGLFYLHGKFVYASRASWELSFGPIPDGLFVCHHCDTPLCVRPGHLFLGTAGDNVLDAAKKGRMRAKITADIAKEIRRAHAAKEASHRVLAGRYGLTYEGVRQIIRKRSWKHCLP